MPRGARDCLQGLCKPFRHGTSGLGFLYRVLYNWQHGKNGRAMDQKILIVEDNELNMKLFHDLLEAYGYTTVRTRDGREALELARKHRPDLIVLDIQLPEISGLEVTRRLKDDDELKSIPIIAVTAFAMKGDEEKIREGGCGAYIAKPISVKSFISTIQKVLDIDDPKGAGIGQ